jgi:hypothetical protein
MERIKDISKLRMYTGSVLIKIKMKQNKIVAPEGNTPQSMVEYAEVIAIHPDVKDLEVGDIVLDFRTSEAFDYCGDKYSVVPRNNVKVAVSPDNFDPGKKVDKRILN